MIDNRSTSSPQNSNRYANSSYLVHTSTESPRSRKSPAELRKTLRGVRFSVRTTHVSPQQLLNLVVLACRRAPPHDAHLPLLLALAAPRRNQFLNRLPLIAGRLKRCMNLEFHFS